MGILRSGMPGSAAQNGISVKCPKCQTAILITAMGPGAPVRCPQCSYPMIRQTDLLAVVAACTAVGDHQVDSAVRILRFLSDTLPEAGTALGKLASRYTLPLNESERWNRMVNAYARGDRNAQEWLNLMCKASPGKYERRVCKNCSAPVFIDKGHHGKMLCVYCQCAD